MKSSLCLLYFWLWLMLPSQKTKDAFTVCAALNIHLLQVVNIPPDDASTVSVQFTGTHIDFTLAVFIGVIIGIKNINMSRKCGKLPTLKWVLILKRTKKINQLVNQSCGDNWSANGFKPELHYFWALMDSLKGAEEKKRGVSLDLKIAFQFTSFIKNVFQREICLSRNQQLSSGEEMNHGVHKICTRI